MRNLCRCCRVDGGRKEFFAMKYDYITVVEKLRGYHSVVLRVDASNRYHHIYPNNGTLSGRLWVYEANGIKGGRVNFSYGTPDREVARQRRDELLSQLRQLGVAVITLHRHIGLPLAA
jgi:hypothetical protein